MNINGIGDGTKLDRLKQMMQDDRIDILFLIETHQTLESIKVLQKTFEDFDVWTRGRNPRQRKQYKGRGGVACVARKNLAKPGIQPKCDDVLWITLGNLSLAVVYFVPATSPFAEKNDKRMQELQTDILTLKQSGEVVIFTDANAWIGEQPSILEIAEDERKIYERKSEKPDINTQGKWFVSCMNSINMIILNGVKSKAKHTFDHPGREAASIVDFVVVDEKVFDASSDIQYFDYREALDTDHWMITLGLRVTLQLETNNKTHKRQLPTCSKTRKNMDLLKKITMKDTFWDAYEQECEQAARNFEITEENSMNQEYEKFKEMLHTSLNEALSKHKPTLTTLTARLKQTQTLRNYEPEESFISNEENVFKS